MQARPTPVDCSVELNAVVRSARKFPLHLFACLSHFPYFAEAEGFGIVPEHGLAKKQSQRHFVHQRFQSAGRFAFPSEIGVRPPPEVPMPVSAVMSLYSESEGVACEPAAIQRDLARK